MKILLLTLLLTFSLSSNAQAPLLPVQNSCASGISVGGVKIQKIPTSEVILEDNFRGDLKATYSMFHGQEIGYAKDNSGASFVIYGKSAYPTDKPTLTNMSMEEYKTGLKNENFEFSQIADWSLLSYKGNRFLCIALSQSMTKAMTYTYLLDLTSKPRRLHFSGVSVKH